MGGKVRYSADKLKNGILRAALFDAWERRCYWCHGWFDVADMEIDHLIPRSYRFNSQRLEELLRDWLSPEDFNLGFDIDAPHNLAPICQDCNNKKGDKPFGKIPIFMGLLKAARKREPEVEKRFHAFYERNDLAKALLTVTVADVDDPKAKETLMKFGSLMVNRLRIVSPDVLETPSNYDYDDPYGEELHHVVVTLVR